MWKSKCNISALRGRYGLKLHDSLVRNTKCVMFLQFCINLNNYKMILPRVPFFWIYCILIINIFVYFGCRLAMDTKRAIFIIGTGDFGCALAKRLIQNGYQVTIGRRSPLNRNLQKRDEILKAVHLVSVRDCIIASTMVVVAIPYKYADSLKIHEDFYKANSWSMSAIHPRDPKKSPMQKNLLTCFPNQLSSNASTPYLHTQWEMILPTNIARYT